MCSHKDKHVSSDWSRREYRCRGRNRWLLLLWPVGGLICLVWFLIRVIPKPSRATYPCQRVAMPIATSFVVWVVGLVGSAIVCRKARALLGQSRYVPAVGLLAIAVAMCWIMINIAGDKRATAAFTPSDPPNTPYGEAKGIYPGRVAWLHDPDATSWDQSTGSWWDDDNTSQAHVDRMISRTLRTLTGQADDAGAWDALFGHFNRTHGFEDSGYRAGEKIAIKINMNQQDGSGDRWRSNDGMPSPHVVYSVVGQLIEVVGVPGSAITIYDASRYIGDPIYDKIRSNPDGDYQAVRFVVKASKATNGRIGAVRDTANPLYTQAGTAYLPTCVTEAKYLINLALLRAHSLYGVTLCAKNHFGSIYFPSRGDWTPSPLHNYGNRERPMGSRNCLVNLNGHEHLSGKTMLYMIDALYSAINQGSRVIPFISFDNDWCSSIFASQDPVAIDSVGLDFLRYEDSINSSINDVRGNPDNYLHEAALADNPPSGTNYDPENDGTRLSSLGVHEHWNNEQDKQYSRNLGTGDGVELVRGQPSPDADFDDDGVVNMKDFSTLAAYWGGKESSVDIAPTLLGDGWVGFGDLDILIRFWLGDMSLAGYWTMDETGGGVLSDSSVYGRQGTLLNMDGAAWVEGKVGNGLEFDGIDDSVEITGYRGIGGKRSRTCSAWIRTDAPGRVIIVWGASGVPGGVWEFSTTAAGQLRVGVGGGFIEGTADVCDGAWHHVAVVAENDGSPNINEVRLYVDGLPDEPGWNESDRTINTLGGADVSIGQSHGALFFEGTIDEVRIYDRALSAEEIAELAR